MSFAVRVALPKERFALDEPVPLEVAAVNNAGGPMPAPVIVGNGAGVGFEVKTAGGEVEFFRALTDPSRPPSPRPTLAQGQAVRGTVDLQELAGPLLPGRHEVTAVVDLTGSRSAPAAFEVERAALIAVAVAPRTATGEDERVVLRLEARGQGALLVVTTAAKDHHGTVRRVAVDAGPASPRSQIALSVAPPRSFDAPAWAVALDGATLARRLLDGEGGARALADIATPAAAARLVAALAGIAGGAPSLHVALVHADAAGARLLALDALADPAAAPTWRSVPLAEPPAAACGTVLDDDQRFVFTSGSAQSESLSVVARSWTTAGIGPPVPVIASKGALLGLEAIASPERDVVRVFAVVRPADPDLALVVETAAIDAAGRVARGPARLYRPEQVPELDGGLRVRAVWEDDLVLLASERGSGRPILARPGDREPWRTPLAAGVSWDVEKVRGGFLHALWVDETSGVVVAPISSPD